MIKLFSFYCNATVLSRFLLLENKARTQISRAFHEETSHQWPRSSLTFVAFLFISSLHSCFVCVCTWALEEPCRTRFISSPITGAPPRDQLLLLLSACSTVFVQREEGENGNGLIERLEAEWKPLPGDLKLLLVLPLLLSLFSRIDHATLPTNSLTQRICEHTKVL